ncbi:MAG: hypothetical protein Ct9H300mP3_11910 [Gammaproteobacteria bacterium]|nr:MAG: hypothetical protein Ct9H300mP3_11910 [Gammaproteobacteria bacterium]
MPTFFQNFKVESDQCPKRRKIYPGELLKEARKKKRRRYKRLSSELGIPEKYLEALEENNFSIMAGPTYIKGYLRAYAKKLI